MSTGVYKITNTVNGKIYIGSVSHARGFELRWMGKYNRYLERSFVKYGKENFKFEVLERCKPEYCLAFEQVYLDYYKPWIETCKGYNISHVAGSCLGIKHSEETKQKLRGINHKWFGKHLRDDIKKKIGDANRGRKRSDEQKKLLGIKK